MMSDPKQDKNPMQQEMQEHIGRKLREMYNHVAHQPVPDRFLALLDQLETVEEPAKGV